jgi:hypothetical protein
MASFVPKYDPELFGEIHQLSTFLPPEENNDSIRSMVRVAGVVAVAHLALLQIVKLWMGTAAAGKKSPEETKAASFAALKASYQLTNLLVNLALGVLGIYHYAIIPRGESVRDKIVGYEHVKLFAVGQVGYQLWGLALGVFFVGELPSMIVHHVAVICVGSVSAFLHCGFRYYIPFFYGLIEISSVPLAVMNAFKNNKHWIKAYPEMYTAVRTAFAVTFLLVRVILWTPNYWDFFCNAAMLLYSSEVITTKVILAVFILSSLILTGLQYFWASKIISALVKGGGPKKKEA